ncbi:hypothetical protein LUZ60_001683 [Juncus effusus]|nr:hypothetical protein LUZ60_001683 [Juncus effusus]
MSNSTVAASAIAGASAGELLILAAAAVPLEHYLVALVVLVFSFLYNFLEFHLLSDILRGFCGDPVKLTFNPASEIYHGVASKCRSLHGRYLATPWLASPHFQTTFLNFFGRPPSFKYNREIYNLRDGGTVALDWLFSSNVSEGNNCNYRAFIIEDTTPLLFVIPGLTSDSASPYLKHLVYTFAKQGWNVVVGNHRGLGGISITSDAFYNAGWTEDVREIINHLHKEYPNAPLYSVGTSIGANILVKYLGEEGENTPLAGGASICSPWDLVVCDRFINRKLVQRLYDRALAIGLKGYAELHQTVLSRLANWEGISKSRTVRDFDNHATRHVAKYETVDTYYRKNSSVSYVEHVSIPLLCVSALDDPVCSSEAIPYDECRVNKNIVLATTTHGGHLAYFEGLTGKRLWWVRAASEFLSNLHESPFTHHQKKTDFVGLHSSVESTIDQSPYVNITEDGLLTPVINNTNNNKNNNDDNDDIITEITPDENNSNNENNNNNDNINNNEGNSSEGKEKKEEKLDKTSSEAINPIKKSLSLIKMHQDKSVWLLAYIAFVTSWPLIGSLAFFFFKKKNKKANK